MDECYMINPRELSADNLGRDALAKEIFNLNVFISWLYKGYNNVNNFCSVTVLPL